jgi:2,4-dienoyl-CoA reductase-like NADH-dependent reductase (Old Yellow Enzyme family)
MVTRKFPQLFSPLKVGPLTFKNRIEAAPTSLAELSPDSYLTRENIANYRLKAKGGAAVVTIGESIVHTPTGKSHPKQIPWTTRASSPRWSRLRTPFISTGPSHRLSCPMGGWNATRCSWKVGTPSGLPQER